MTVTDLWSAYVKIRIYGAILYLLFYVSVKLDLQTEEQYNLSLSRKTVLRGIFRTLKKEVTGGGENYTVNNFMIFDVHRINNVKCKRG